MFTGIIQEIGHVKNAVLSGGNLRLQIEAPDIAGKLQNGFSVNINGACQTVVAFDKNRFEVEAIKETLSRTNLGKLKSGSAVNLEMPLSPGDLLHGHLVQGHVDCTGRISQIRPAGGSTDFEIDFPGEYGKYLIEKGSVAIDGVSLTVVNVSLSVFSVSIIPHTMNNTTFRYKRTGDSVNLEFDMIAKYIEKMVPGGGRGLTEEFLKEHGF